MEEAAMEEAAMGIGWVDGFWFGLHCGLLFGGVAAAGGAVVFALRCNGGKR